MNADVLKPILLEYEKLRDKHKVELEKRKEEVYSKIPQIKEIDEKIFKIGLDLARSVLQSPEQRDVITKKCKEEMEKLRSEKINLMQMYGYSLDYLDIKYVCTSCKDTGFLQNGKKCSCLNQKLINLAYKMSNLSKVLEKENFNTFNDKLFSDKKSDSEQASPRENIWHIYSICESFILNFDKDNGENLLFYGTTGLGKTFMCNCIAKELLDRGKIVIYQTAFKILEIIEEYKFKKDTSSLTRENYKLLFDCDLLIIDDLGTEVTNSFTTSEIFNIVNTRLIQGKKTIISTNLSPMEIANTYTDRIFSRIFSNFRILKFYGQDLRWEKRA
ncbi:DNA replication protein DnaC [Alkalithermobacter thermoalcaliphilus JW-YL-7 = DSM 7308]|uniref:DNA replication protein DnaC n=1 Tax=Alkalithermobacter thermoalcaliphilus JW-YL-7 = DSM 7308 TaxID=1121328 RepID=A0A150FSX5_CLOPD|nr:IstB domain protein ATP-binding protein [[Clostridium] paradoxum JW-YL-7 = DSM 7308]SHL09694.1 DNA replication protein DnaC [[Clostridium] paradoxum JW-YL-7 = DSM 7308]